MSNVNENPQQSPAKKRALTTEVVDLLEFVALMGFVLGIIALTR